MHFHVLASIPAVIFHARFQQLVITCIKRIHHRLCIGAVEHKVDDLAFLQVAGIRFIAHLDLPVDVFRRRKVFRLRPAVCHDQIQHAAALGGKDQRLIVFIEPVDDFLPERGAVFVDVRLHVEHVIVIFFDGLSALKRLELAVCNRFCDEVHAAVERQIPQAVFLPTGHPVGKRSFYCRGVDGHIGLIYMLRGELEPIGFLKSKELFYFFGK